MQDVLDLPTLVAYISYARKTIHPQISDEAAEELTRGYVDMRRRGNTPGSRKKVRESHPLQICIVSTLTLNWRHCIFFPFLFRDQVITATARQIESLIRLSEALARMRFSEWVGTICLCICYNHLWIISGLRLKYRKPRISLMILTLLPGYFCNIYISPVN